MNKLNAWQRSEEGVSYRLRNRVTCGQDGGVAHLILSFPLKVVMVHTRWIPVFEKMKSDGPLALENIVSMAGTRSPKKTEAFLDDLVRKGLLERQGLAEPERYPSVSIIIPVRNRTSEIADCLTSLQHLDYPCEKLEIIVVDDASTDDTPDVIRQYPVHFIGLTEHRQASYCRNLAARKANGEILAFIDSDCLASILWLRELVPSFEDKRVGAVGGLVDAYFKDKVLDRYETVKSSLNVCQRFKRSDEEDRFFYVPSCNLLTRRSLYLDLGGFREDLIVGEDVDYCWRMQDRGALLEYRPLGRIYHKHRNKPVSFCRRRFDYGTSEPLLQKMHRRRAKHFMLPLPGALFLGFLILSGVLEAWLPVFMAFSVFLMDAFRRQRAVSRRRIPVRFDLLFVATFRSYLTLLLNLCFYVSRYYLIWAIAAFPILPKTSMVMIGMHLLTGSMEFMIKSPKLDPFRFVFCFTLDQISYQLGVWRGCFRRACFSPINPRLVWRMAPWRQG